MAWPDIDALRVREHAAAIVTTNYALTAWLSFYLPGHPTVIQLNERSRYLNDQRPDPQLFRAPLIYVSQVRNEQTHYFESRFATSIRWPQSRARVMAQRSTNMRFFGSTARKVTYWGSVS